MTIDGKAPGNDHGTDTDADGIGTVDSQRLYQLVRQQGKVGDRTFEIKRKPGRADYLVRLRKFRSALPVDFVFDRDSANTRD